MELDHEYGQLERIKNLTDEVLQLKENLSTCKCTEQLLAARCAMPPGDTRPGRAAHANPYAVDVPTGVWNIFGLKEMTVEDLNNKLKTIEAKYELCNANIAYYTEWLQTQNYSIVYDIFENEKKIESIRLPVYKKKIERLKWLINPEHSKEKIEKHSDLQAERKKLDAELKSEIDHAHAELRDLEKQQLIIQAQINNNSKPPRQVMQRCYYDRYGTKR